MPKRADDKKPGRSATKAKSTTAKRATTTPRPIAKPAVPTAAARKKADPAPLPRRVRVDTRPVAMATPSRAGRRSVRPTARAAVESVTAPAATRGFTGVPVQVVTIADVYSGDPGSNPGSAEFAYRILAEGDSWFTIGGIPSSNLLYELRLPQPAIVCNIALPGDTLKRIAELARNQDLKKLLTERFGYRWHAILLSAGGNDLIERAPQLLRNPGNGSSDARDYLVSEQLEGFVRDVQDGYRAIVALRDATESVNHGVPIVVHGYDYPTPRNAPAHFVAVPLLGPWLQRAFDDLQIAEAVRVPITDFLVDVLAEAIKTLAAEPTALPGFHYVETRGTLQRAATGATGTSGDWLNETHPSHEGYRKIAAIIGAKVGTLVAA